MRITPTELALSSITGISGGRESDSEQETGFSELLSSSLAEVNSLQKNADHLSEKMARGELENLHDAVIAAEKADLALNLTIEIRNKVMEAYQEVMRMQV